MYERFNSYTETKPRLRRIGGWFLVVFGFVALVTPLTPGGILFFVGLELLGIRFIGTEKLKSLFRKASPTPVSEVVSVESASQSTP